MSAGSQINEDLQDLVPEISPKKEIGYHGRAAKAVSKIQELSHTQTKKYTNLVRISQKLNEKKDIGCGIAELEIDSRLGSAHMSMDKESNFSNFATIPIKMNNSPVFT